jgi:urate oxidase
VIKTTGSAFENFVRDEYTTLVEVNDRIFSTSVNLKYAFKSLSLGSAGEEELKKIKETTAFDKTAVRARDVTLEIFATDESASVQVKSLNSSGSSIAARTHGIGTQTLSHRRDAV